MIVRKVNKRTVAIVLVKLAAILIDKGVEVYERRKDKNKEDLF